MVVVHGPSFFYLVQQLEVLVRIVSLFTLRTLFTYSYTFFFFFFFAYDALLATRTRHTQQQLLEGYSSCSLLLYCCSFVGKKKKMLLLSARTRTNTGSEAASMRAPESMHVYIFHRREKSCIACGVRNELIIGVG